MQPKTIGLGRRHVEPLEHSVLKMSLDNSSLNELPDDEPLEHAVLHVTPDGGPMEGAPVLEPLEHLVLEKSLDSGHMEGAPVLILIEHSVLEKPLDGGPMEGAPVLEAIEHSVLEMSLDGGLMKGISQLEPLEDSVPNAALNSQPIEGAPFLHSSKCSVLQMGLAKGLMTEDGGPPLGPDRNLTLSNGPHVTGIVDRVLSRLVPLPAEDVGRETLSPADGRLRAGDGNTDGNIMTGFQCWNTEGDVQYETFNVMPVYYGGDLYDSEDSD